MGPPVRVLHVIDSLGSGGAERMLYDMLAGWTSPGWTFEVASLHGFSPYGELLSAIGVPIHVLGRSRLDAPRIVLRLRRLLRDARPDLLHLHLTGSALLGSLLRPAGLPVVIQDQSGAEYYAGSRGAWNRLWLLPLERRLWRRAACVVANSRSVESFNRDSRRLPQESLRVVGNAIDLRRFPGDRARGRRLLAAAGVPESAVVVGSVGRLYEYKGFDLLVRAFAALGRAGETRLVIVGGGPEHDRLHGLARELGVADRVVLTGPRHPDEIPHLMTAYDVFVLPSRSEPFGIVGLEAMACSVPLIAASVGGIPDYVEPGVNGTLVPPNDVSAFAEAIARCLAGGEWIRRSAATGRDHALSRWSVASFVGTMEDVYREALRRRGSVRRESGNTSA